MPAILPTEVRPGGLPKGDLAEEELGSSMGDVFPVDEPERGWSIIEGGRYPSEGCSDREEAIYIYIFAAAPVRAGSKGCVVWCVEVKGLQKDGQTLFRASGWLEQQGRWEAVLGNFSN